MAHERDEESADAILMEGGSATVSVTVRMPYGVTATANEEIRVYLYTPAQIDASGRVVQSPHSLTRATANFQPGDSASTAVFNGVAAGDYILRTYTTRMENDKLLNGTFFYHGDGSMATGQYTATPFSVAQGASLNKTITLPQSEASISGALNFSAPLPEETEFEVYCTAQDTTSGSHYVYFSGEKGARSVPFSIGVKSGCYTIDFSVEDSYYLDYDGRLTEDYQKRCCYELTVGERKNGLSVNGDILLGGEAGTNETVRVEFTITLPEVSTLERRFYVAAVRSDSNDRLETYSTSSVTVPAGQATLSTTLTLAKGAEYAIGYRDTTDCYTVYGISTSNDMRYFSAGNSVTTLFENARKFRFTADASVSLREPACARVTGRVNRNGFDAGTRADAYAYALFPDGERYCARVLLGSADSAEYVIYVPLKHSGQTFQLSAMMARPNTNYPIEESVSKSVSRKFSGDVSAGTLSVSGDYFTISGTVSLPQGVKAPADGQSLYLNTPSGNIYYVLPAGQNSLSFSLQIYKSDSSRSESITAYLSSPLSGVYRRVTQSRSFEESASDSERKAWYKNRSLVFPASAVISGSVSLPPGTRDVGLNAQLYAYFEGSDSLPSVSASHVISIPKGQTSSAYRLTVPVRQLSYLRLSMMSSTDGRAAEDTFYVDGDWTVVSAERPGKAPNVTTSRANLNFAFSVFSSGVTPQITSVKSWAAVELQNPLEEVRKNNTLRVVCVGPLGTEASLIATTYDEQGRLLDVTVDSYISLSRSGEEAYIQFRGQEASSAATLRLFLIDRETRVPLSTPLSFN